MKQTKTKVLLTLLVAVAMMLFAVPAFAADTSFHIDTQPSSATVYSTTSATFTTAVKGGTPDYSYVWQYKPVNGVWTDFASANTSAKTAKLVIPSTDAAYVNGTVVRCTATDSAAQTDQTKEATLTLISNASASVTKTSPSDDVIKAGDKVTLLVTPSNFDSKATLSYQWQVNKNDTKGYVDISGATDETYTTDATSIDMNNYTYQCVVKDTNAQCDGITSDVFTLKVKDAVSIKTQPVSQETYANESKTFKVEALGGSTAGGNGSYTYKWEVNDGNGWKTVADVAEVVSYSGSTTANLTVTPLSDKANGYQYRCTVSAVKAAESTNDGSEAVSNAATLTVKPSLAVTTDPTGTVRIASGSTLTITATATGGRGVYHYAWYAANAAGQATGAPLGTDATFTTEKLVANDTNGYVCVVTDAKGDSRTSDPVKVVVTGGSLSDGTVNGVYTTNPGTDITEVTFTLTLPDGVKFVDNLVNNGTTINWVTNNHGLTATIVNHNDGSNSLTFKMSGKPTSSGLDALEVTVPGSVVSTNSDINITTNDNAKFNITETAFDGIVKTDPSSVIYNGKAQTTSVVAASDALKTKIGAISNVRYYTGQFDMTTIGETNVGLYNVVCDIADGTQYTAKANVAVAGGFEINIADPEYVAAHPSTYFTWTASKEYTGKTLSADVAFADGITKAGKITKVEYVAYDSTGVLPTNKTYVTNPTAIGKYEIYVTTAGTDATNVAPLTRVDLGTFEITKLQPKAAMFTQTPTTADYTGSPIAVTVAPTKDYDGKVGAVTVKYFTEDGKTQLAGAPTAAGKYVIKVDVAASDTYAAATDLEIGTLTINSTTAPSITYSAHVQNIGWQTAVSDWGIAGTEGQSLRMEAIEISVPTTANVQLKAQAHEQNIGWDTVQTGSDVKVGTTGQSLRMEALRLQLTGTDAAKYQIRVKAHIQNYGWTDDKVIKSTDDFNNTTIGTTGESLRMEAIKIIIEPVSK